MRSSNIYKPAIFLFILICLSIQSFADKEDEYKQLREEMVQRQLVKRGITDSSVLEAMRTVPRHLFVLKAYRHLAYADHPLPIEAQQTISQPYIVAKMTQSIDIKKGEKVLEIGTGSGYQAAVLAHLTNKVYTIEIIEELAKKARETLIKLGYNQIHVKWGDGHTGWKEEAPFDAIIITCASPQVPPRLFEQLKEGGRIILPLGNPLTSQTLTIITKVNGKPKTKRILAVRFVPMTKR
jgi:protein-L-isoaspartate(D-aspartate) O-methyltransferase